MTGWKIKITEEAQKDFGRLEGSIKKQVLAGILKVSGRAFTKPQWIWETTGE